MERIEVGRYKNPESHGWAGWINPEREEEGNPFPKWTLFINVDGRVALGIRDESGDGLQFATEFGTEHPRTFTGEEAPG